MFFSVKVKILWAFVLLLYAQRRQVKAETIDVDVFTDDMLKEIKQQLTIFQDKYDVMKRQIPHNPSNDKNIQDQYGSEELLGIQNRLTTLLTIRQTRDQSDKLSALADKLTILTEELKTQFKLSKENINEKFQKLPKKSDFCTFGKELTKHLIGNMKTHVETQNEQLVKSSTKIESTSNEIKNKLSNYIETFTTSQNEQTEILKSGLPNSCSAAIRSGNGAGDYQILISNKPTPVYCDQRGRMMIQHQMKGDIDFFDCDWSQYRSGFGKPKSQYWFGLENLHLLTTSQRYELHMDLVDFDNVTTQIIYDHFEIGGESDMYRLNKVGEFTGNPIDDRFGSHIELPFTTRDKNNDKKYCAIIHKSGWWFNHCDWVNLNQKVKANKNEENWEVLFWGVDKLLKEASMYIKLHEF